MIFWVENKTFLAVIYKYNAYTAIQYLNCLQVLIAHENVTDRDRVPLSDFMA